MIQDHTKNIPNLNWKLQYLGIEFEVLVYILKAAAILNNR